MRSGDRRYSAQALRGNEGLARKMDLRIFGYDNIDVLVEFSDEKAMVKQKYLV